MALRRDPDLLLLPSASTDTVVAPDTPIDRDVFLRDDDLPDKTDAM